MNNAGQVDILDRHILPRFSLTRMRDLDRRRISLSLAEKLNAGLHEHAVRNILAVLPTMLNAAIQDGLIASNPAAKLGRVLKLTVSKPTTEEEIKAMTKAQRHLFLNAAAQKAAVFCPSTYRHATWPSPGSSI
jgi:hypothetical protein